MKKPINKEEQKNRLSLTLLFAGIILVFLIVTLLFAIGLGYLLIELGVIKVIDDTDLSPTTAFLLMGINSLVLGAILAGLSAKFPLKPVNKIISLMNRLASGDFSVRMEFKKPFGNIPAVQEICDSFNTMAQELGATEMLRSDFINNFSHEFKTPIVSITGFAKLLKRGNLTEEQRMEYLDIIEEESVRLTALATNMLNLTKYENQTILTDVTDFNLSEQIRSCILALEGKWAKKNIAFDLEFEEHRIWGNKDMLKHTWMNLLDNAIKFSPEGETVEIRIRKQGGQYVIAISNHGEEIPPEQTEKIFLKFYQADESHATEGNGIGLALVKGVVELHQGRVEVGSQNGTVTFSVTLPKHQGKL